ncbi:hypothetical protein [Chitinilyticum aquatile]|uniref:hypothetical protein n=1 Tax=Chitinilyticum aquatile TaxID=362520 RepID=UPI00048C1EE3|nr:hypothetical protein [Chitinilyticum aquatile]
MTESKRVFGVSRREGFSASGENKGRTSVNVYRVNEVLDADVQVSMDFHGCGATGYFTAAQARLFAQDLLAAADFVEKAVQAGE